MIYVDPKKPVRNIYGECLYVAIEVDIAEMQIAERMIRYNLRMRDYIILETNQIPSETTRRSCGRPAKAGCMSSSTNGSKKISCGPAKNRY